MKYREWKAAIKENGVAEEPSEDVRKDWKGKDRVLYRGALERLRHCSFVIDFLILISGIVVQITFYFFLCFKDVSVWLNVPRFCCFWLN